jgi:hypothetical protein
MFKTILFLIIFIVSTSNTKKLNTQKNNKEKNSTIKTNLIYIRNKFDSIYKQALGEKCVKLGLISNCKYSLKCDKNIQGINVCMNKVSKLREYCVYQIFGSMCEAGLTCSKKDKKCIKK